MVKKRGTKLIPMLPTLHSLPTAPAVTQLFSLNVTTSGHRPILLDNVTCEGTETRLTECLHNGFGIHGCSHTHDAGVSCPGVLTIKLMFSEAVHV